MNALQSFQFHTHLVNVDVDDQGEPWFIAKQISEALEYSDAYEMTKKLDDDEKSNRQIAGLGPGTGGRGIICINESGLYSAILTSKKPAAKSFKKWVTSEVLPSIRKTGGYGVNRVPSGPMTLAQYHAHQRTIAAYQQELLGAHIVFTGEELAALKITPQLIDLALGDHENEPTITDMIIQMHKDGCTRHEISVRIGRSRNYVRQILFHANKKGLLSESQGGEA
jgi:prophage antirepressor-like protein